MNNEVTVERDGRADEIRDLIGALHVAESQDELRDRVEALSEAFRNKLGGEADELLDAVAKNQAVSCACAGDVAGAVSLLRRRFASEPIHGDAVSSWGFEVTPRIWLVRGWIPAHRFGLLVGVGGQGKSRLGVQLASSIAAGKREWLGPEGPTLDDATPRPVVWCSWEDEPFHVRTLLGDVATSVGNRFHFLRPRGPVWAPGGGRAGKSSHVSTMGSETSTGRYVLDYARRVRASLLVLDPLAAAYMGDESSRSLVRAYCAALDAWGQAHACTVLCVAHPSKSALRDGGDEFGSISGSTDWHSAARYLIRLGPAKDPRAPKPASKTPTYPAMRLGKSSYGREGGLVWLRSEFPHWWASEVPQAAGSSGRRVNPHA